MKAIEMAKIAADAAAERKAVRVVLLDLSGISDVCDFQLICSGENDRQTKAISLAIEERFKKQFGVKPIAIEGRQSGHWILLDYGSTIVHVFLSSVRDYYAIEELWPNAKLIDPASI